MGLTDATPYLIVTQTSIDELNTRLDHSVSSTNFRPSILLTGTKHPFEEVFILFIACHARSNILPTHVHAAPVMKIGFSLHNHIIIFPFSG